VLLDDDEVCDGSRSAASWSSDKSQACEEVILQLLCGYVLERNGEPLQAPEDTTADAVYEQLQQQVLAQLDAVWRAVSHDAEEQAGRGAGGAAALLSRDLAAASLRPFQVHRHLSC
jgi:hypothetical protein